MSYLVDRYFELALWTLLWFICDPVGSVFCISKLMASRLLPSVLYTHNICAADGVELLLFTVNKNQLDYYAKPDPKNKLICILIAKSIFCFILLMFLLIQGFCHLIKMLFWIWLKPRRNIMHMPTQSSLMVIYEICFARRNARARS
jgi:hypothetical protein